MLNKTRLVVVASISFILGRVAAGGMPIPQASEEKANDPPFVIHYGLNDSHGRSWVQENGKGVVGVVYFERDEGTVDEGTLVYMSIRRDGSKITQPVTTGKRLEKSVLLYDSLDEPHVFVASSNDTDQVIDHYFMSDSSHWQNETLFHFSNEGGKFIYELSADKGPDHSFHLLILKTRSNIDSDDFMDAWIDSYLYYLTNVGGSWEKELVYNYDMPYTYDMCIKSSIRQDIAVDKEGFVHIAFGQQVSGTHDPSRLMYATNKTGFWEMETALSNDFGPVDDAGWFPSLCLDIDGVPHISCIYLNRVLTHSVMYSKLLLLKREGAGDWHSEIVCEYDDGYYGSDGRDYTGALCHLVFDNGNKPHIVFSDIAATHWDWQRLNVGNIRYAVFEDSAWNISTIYRQPLPAGFFNAIEMLWMSLIVSDLTSTIHIIGQEIEVTGEFEYSCRLIEFVWSEGPSHIDGELDGSLPGPPYLSQNYPNPFNPATVIEYSVPARSQVKIEIFNVLGQKVRTLVNETREMGSYRTEWNGVDDAGSAVATGVYFYRFRVDDAVQTKKMLLTK